MSAYIAMNRKLLIAVLVVLLIAAIVAVASAAVYASSWNRFQVADGEPGSWRFVMGLGGKVRAPQFRSAQFTVAGGGKMWRADVSEVLNRMGRGREGQAPGRPIALAAPLNPLSFNITGITPEISAALASGTALTARLEGEYR